MVDPKTVMLEALRDLYIRDWYAALEQVPMGRIPDALQTCLDTLEAMILDVTDQLGDVEELEVICPEIFETLMEE